MDRERVWVIGAKSFLGNEIIRELKRFNLTVIGMDRSNLDLIEMNSVRNFTQKIGVQDTLVFCAGIVPCKDTIEFDLNIRMITNLFEAIKERFVKNFVYISSDAVYSDSKSPLKEEDKCNPNSLHGKMHLARENLVKSNFKMNHLIVRPTLIYGKNDPHNGYGPNKFIREALNTKEINLFGAGEEMRDHIHVNEVAIAISRLILGNFKGNFNICTGRLRSFMEIAVEITEYLKPKFEVQVRTNPRLIPIPHNGFRPIDNSKLLQNIRNLEFAEFITNLSMDYPL